MNTSVFKKEYQNIFDLIPIIPAIGAIMGFGGYFVLIGFIISLLISIIFKSKQIFLISLPAIIFLNSANYYLGGKIDSLIAMTFLGGVFIMLFAKFNLNSNLKIRQTCYLAYLTSLVIILAPLLFGIKTVSTLPLFLKYDFSANAGEGDIILSIVFFGAYYYLSKYKNLPAMFLSFILTVLINLIYKLPCLNLSLGITYLKFPASANFAHFYLILLFSFLFAFISKEFLRGKLNTVKNSLISGGSFITSSFFGGVSGNVSKIKINSYYVKILILILFFAIAHNFLFISKYIPLCAVICPLFICTVKNFKKPKLKFKTPFIKILFGIYFIICAIFPPSGALIMFISSIIKRFYDKKTKN